MPISAGLREDIAVYRSFIGQQYFALLYIPMIILLVGLNIYL